MSSNLLFVRRFTYLNKGNLFLSLILAKFWRYIFNLRLSKRVIAQDPSLGRVLFTNALLILIEPLGKIEK